MQQHDRIEQEIRKQIQLSRCQYVLDNACRFDDPTFPVKSKKLAAEDTTIRTILLDLLPSAVWRLGRTCYLLNDFDLFYYHLQEAYQLFNTLPHDDLGLQRLGGQCEIDLVDCARRVRDDSDLSLGCQSEV